MKEQILAKVSYEEMVAVLNHISFVFRESKAIQGAFNYVAENDSERAKSMLFDYMVEMLDDEESVQDVLVAEEVI